MSRIGNFVRAKAFREKARACDGFAKSARSTEDRSRLLRMRDAWFARASQEDLIGGLPPLPPVMALPVPANS